MSANPPLSPPATVKKLKLNKYGRACFDAGYEYAAAELSTLRAQVAQLEQERAALRAALEKWRATHVCGVKVMVDGRCLLCRETDAALSSLPVPEGKP